MVVEAPCFESKTHIKLVTSWLCPLLLCEQDKAASYMDSEIHTEVAMKGLGRGKKRLQDIIVEFQPQTDEMFMVDKRTHTYTHTHTHTHTHTEHSLN